MLARKRRCNQCHGCLAIDCGNCSNCKDKPKFGGPGRKKQCCITRKCLRLKEPATNDNIQTDLPSASIPSMPYPVSTISLLNEGISLHGKDITFIFIRY